MGYRLQVSLRNPGSKPIDTVVYPGTIFEVEDPFSGVQNLAAVGKTSVTVHPGESRVVEIDTWCLNHFFSPPSNTRMRLTGLQLARQYADQGEVWDDLDSRR